MIKNYNIKKMNTLYNLSEDENFGADITGQILFDMDKQTQQVAIKRLLVDMDIPEGLDYDQVYLVLPFRYGSITTTQDVTITIHKITQPWTNGDSCWKNRTKIDQWGTPGGDYQTTPYKQIIHKFNYENITDNLVINLNDYLLDPGYGLLIRFDADSGEQDDIVGFLKYYSPTIEYIFKPYVAVYIDDFQYQQIESKKRDGNQTLPQEEEPQEGQQTNEKETTEQEFTYSKLQLNEPFYLNISNFSGQYYGHQQVLFSLNLFPKQIRRTFGKMSYVKKTKHILPEQANSLFYSVIDISQPERKVVIPFDQVYTRVSFSKDDGMYFKFDFTNLQVNRTYKFQFSYKTDKQKIIIPTDYRFRLKP